MWTYYLPSCFGCLYFSLELKFPQQNVLWKLNEFPRCTASAISALRSHQRCRVLRRTEFHADGEDAGPGDDERPEDTRDGRARPVLPLPADLHVGGHRRPDGRAGVLVCHQTSPHQAPLQPAAPIWGSAGETSAFILPLAAGTTACVQERKGQSEGSALNYIAEICWKIWNLVVKTKKRIKV